MATKTLSENINQAISDLNGVKQALIDKGVEIPSGTKTSEYGAKIGEIQSGGGGEIEKGFVPTETNENGFVTKGILKGMTEVPSYLFNNKNESEDCYSTYLQDISFEKPITSIGDYSFARCTNLTLTSLPESLTSIGKYGLGYCRKLALQSLPENLKSIGVACFAYCDSLALTSLPSGLTSIGGSAFHNCKKLR